MLNSTKRMGQTDVPSRVAPIASAPLRLCSPLLFLIAQLPSRPIAFPARCLLHAASFPAAALSRPPVPV